MPQYIWMSPYVWMPPVCLEAPICLVAPCMFGFFTYMFGWPPVCLDAPYVWMLPMLGVALLATLFSLLQYLVLYIVINLLQLDLWSKPEYYDIHLCLSFIVRFIHFTVIFPLQSIIWSDTTIFITAHYWHITLNKYVKCTQNFKKKNKTMQLLFTTLHMPVIKLAYGTE